MSQHRLQEKIKKNMVPLNHLPESYMTFFKVRKPRTVKQKLCLVASQLLLRKRGETLSGVLKKMRVRKKL